MPRPPIRRQRKFSEPPLGTRLKALAVLRGYSLRELAAATGLKYSRVRNIAYGDVIEVHSHEIYAMADALEGSVTWLLTGHGDPLETRVRQRISGVLRA